MLGSRLCLAAVALGTTVLGTSVSECQSAIIDLSDDPCADLCDWYGNKDPQRCGNLDLIDCVVQLHPEQCELQIVPTRVTTKDPAATQKPTPILRSAVKAITNDWSSIYPLECTIEACQIRVKGIKESDTAFCQDECVRIGGSTSPSFCPEAVLGEDYLMKCMVEEYYPKVCYDSMPADTRVCDFQEDCVVKECRSRIWGTTLDETIACRNLCNTLILTPKLCPMDGKGDDELASCVVQRGDNCSDKLAGSGPKCVPQVHA